MAGLEEGAYSPYVTPGATPPAGCKEDRRRERSSHPFAGPEVLDSRTQSMLGIEASRWQGATGAWDRRH
jgi:hypothetical protein